MRDPFSLAFSSSRAFNQKKYSAVMGKLVFRLKLLFISPSAHAHLCGKCLLATEFLRKGDNWRTRWQRQRISIENDSITIDGDSAHLTIGEWFQFASTKSEA
jgi:hypothetical protein